MSSSTLTLPVRTFRPAAAAKAAALAVLVALLLIPVAIAIHAGIYDSFMDNALTGFGMWGTFAIHMCTRPLRKERTVTILLGLVMRVAYDFAIGERGYTGSILIGMGTFMGMASLVVLMGRSLEAPGERRAVCRRALAIVGLFSYISVCLAFYVSFARLALPRKFDYLLFHFDGSLGFQPSFAVGRLLAAFRPFYWTEVMVYNSFGFWFAVLYAVHAGARVKYPVSVVKMIIANAFIGFSLYFLCPAMGPKYAFAAFPNLPGTVPHGVMAASGVPNAMPSLHFGGTLLIFWLSRPWKWLYRWMGLFAVLTALATLGLGEHYLIDLVAAVPYALAILAFSSRVPERKLPICAGAAMLFFWLVTLRFASFPPAIAWALVLATVAAGFTLERRLARKLWIASPTAPSSAPQSQSPQSESGRRTACR